MTVPDLRPTKQDIVERLARFNTPSFRWTAYVITRVIMVTLPLLTLLPEPYAVRSGIEGDVSTYLRQHNLIFSGQLPYRDFVLEYPPGALALLIVPGRLALTAGGYLTVWVAQSLVLDLLGYAAIKRLVRLTGTSKGAARAQWCWIVSGPLLGGLTLVRNDLLACVAVAWGVVFLAERRPHLAGAFLGFAVLAKVWPLLVLGALVLARPMGRWALVRGASQLAVVAAFFLQMFGMLLPMLHVLATYHGSRGLQVESVAAYPWLVASRLRGHAPATIANFGSHNLIGHRDIVIATTYISLAVVGALMWATWRRGRRSALSLPAGLACAATIVGASMLTDKVVSPQYCLWLLVVIALAADAGAVAAGTLISCGAFVLLTGLVYPSFYFDLVAGEPVGLVLQGLRLLSLIVTVLLASSALRGGAPDSLVAAVDSGGVTVGVSPPVPGQRSDGSGAVRLPTT